MWVSKLALSCVACAALVTAPVAASSKDKAPDTWDGLKKVPSKRLDLVYLQPQADFGSYTKVMLDPVEIAFRKNWRKEINRQSAGLGGDVSDDQAQKILALGREIMDKELRQAFSGAGYQVVTAPGPDVLRVSTAIINLHITSPEVRSAGRTSSYSQEAGWATFAVEVRDSATNDLMGRAVDNDTAGDMSIALRRNTVTNRADFEQMFSSWATLSARGLNELKALSPIDVNGQRTRK